MMSMYVSLPAGVIRRVGVLVLVGALAVITGGCSNAAAPSSPTGQPLPSGAASAVALRAPVSGSDVRLIAPGPAGVAAVSGGTSVGGVSSAIAYPYPIYGGSPGVAPDHSILVTGSGQADLAADGSNRAAAEHKALVAAVADAKSRAEAVATATGVSIQGVLSVSVSVGQGWIGPVGIESPGGVTVPPANGSGPAPVPPIPPTPTTPQLEVTVTIAYTIG